MVERKEKKPPRKAAKSTSPDAVSEGSVYATLGALEKRSGRISLG